MKSFEDAVYSDFGIYSIKNIINNKIYIGSTCKSFRKRFNEHINALKSNRHDNPLIQNSWVKYGETNFEFEIIEYFSQIEIEELLKIEESYIMKFNSLNRNFGYNICHVGKSRLGTSWSDESKKNRCGENNPMFGKGHLRKGDLNPMFGKHLSESHKKKMSLSLTGIKKPVTSEKLSKPVIMLNNTGDILNEFCSFIEAQRATKILHINEVCNGNRKSAGGYLWKWKVDYAKI